VLVLDYFVEKGVKPQRDLNFSAKCISLGFYCHNFHDPSSMQEMHLWKHLNWDILWLPISIFISY